jgi:hypothetical protein
VGSRQDAGGVKILSRSEYVAVSVAATWQTEKVRVAMAGAEAEIAESQNAEC